MEGSFIIPSVPVNPRLERNPVKPADTTDIIGSIDVASDGTTNDAQERIRAESQGWLSREKSCVTEDVYDALEHRVAEMLASQEAERLDLEREFGIIRAEILAGSHAKSTELAQEHARETSLAPMGLEKMPDRYAPVERYFGLDAPTVTALRDVERDTGLSVMPALARYQSVIERSLVRTADSSLPETRVAELRAAMREHVAARAAKIPEIVTDHHRKHSGASASIDRNDRWIINSELVSAFADIEAHVLPEARWYLQMHESGYTQALRTTKPYQDGEALSARYGTEQSVFAERLDTRLSEAESMLFGGNSLWQRARNAGVSAMNRLDERTKYHDDAIESMAVDGHANGWTEAKKNRTDFLTETDRTIEEDATIACVIACVCQMTPYVGATLSAVTDTEDIFSNYDATTRWLQRCGVVDASYRTDK